MHERQTTPPSILILVMLNGLWSSVMQITLPALPEMARDLAVSARAIQWVLTGFMISVAFGQLVYGPFSDRHGRKIPLLVGLTIFLVGSAICAWSPNLATLLIGRCIQGAGACAGAVLSRAMIRDAFKGDEAAVRLGHVSMAMSISPIVATIGGGYVVESLGWRMPFLLEIAAGLALIVAITRVDETHHHRTALPRLGATLRGFSSLLSRRAFLVPALAIGFTGGAFTSFVNIAPMMLEDVFGVPGTRFGYYFMMLPCGFLLGAWAGTGLMRRIGAPRTARCGIVASVLTGATLLALVLSGHSTPLSIFAVMALVTAAQALVQAPCVMQAISTDPRLVGAASGLVGFIQMGSSAASSQVGAEFYDGTSLPPTILVMTLELGALAMLSFRRAGRPI